MRRTRRLVVAGLVAALLPLTLVGSAGPASATDPNCFTVPFQVDNPPYKKVLSLQTCVRPSGDGYKAEMFVFRAGDQAVTDRVKVTYRIELRNCADNRLLSANPRTTTETFGTAGGSSWLFYASTGPVPGNVFAIAHVQNTYFTMLDPVARRAYSGPAGGIVSDTRFATCS